MIPKQSLSIKIASEDWEFEAVHRLNHRTFAEEIPQHAVNAEMLLIDKFHDQNTYAICLDGRRLVGMICGRNQRPFSLDGKIQNLDDYLPPGRKPVEVRLLSVEKDYRNGVVFCGLVRLLSENFRRLGCDLAIISGTTRQLKLYRHLGFEPFGPLVGTPRSPVSTNVCDAGEIPALVQYRGTQFEAHANHSRQFPFLTPTGYFLLAYCPGEGLGQGFWPLFVYRSNSSTDIVPDPSRLRTVRLICFFINPSHR